MAGLVPAIHVLFPKSEQKQDVDARDKPGMTAEKVVHERCLYPAGGQTGG